MKIEIRGNNLLNSLIKSDIELLLPHLREMEAPKGKVLYEPGDDVKYAYFPCNHTLVSYLVIFEDARGVETASIGREGAVGGIVSQGLLPAYCRSVVQTGGTLLRIESVLLEEAKMTSLSLRHIFARYSDCLLAQIFQAVACNATHTIEQRTARWLVAAVRRTGDHLLPVGQEQLANMLGVGRSYIARILGHFKELGFMETSREKLMIKSLPALEKASCNCDALVGSHFSTVLSGTYPPDMKSDPRPDLPKL